MINRDALSAAAMQDAGEVLDALERRYSLRSGFLAELQTDPDDWSYLVRFQSFLEALLTDAVVAKVGRPKLRSYVQGMNIGGNRGLVALAIALDTLSEQHGRFLACLADTRNAFAHRIANIDRTLQEYVDELPQSQRVALWKAVLFHRDGERWEQPREDRSTLGGLIRNFFWLCGLSVATQLNGTISEREKLDITAKLRASVTKLEPAVADFAMQWDVKGGLLSTGEERPAK